MSQTYTFANLSLTFETRGVPFLSEKTKARIAEMPVAEAKAANKEAWKQKRETARILNRHNNVSVSGNLAICDRFDQQHDVADLVCKATYRRMCNA